MNYILFDDNKVRENFLPLTFMRPVANIRFGILTFQEKWIKYLNSSISFLTQDYLKIKFPLKVEVENILINSSVCPSYGLIQKIKNLKPNQGLKKDEKILAVNLNREKVEKLSSCNFDDNSLAFINVDFDILDINYLWDIFSKNDKAIKDDFFFITKGRKSQSISKTNTVFNKENIFVEEGAKIECAVLNAETGPIYIGKYAEVMEGSIVRGSFALCEHSTLKMCAKIYGPTTIGPHSKVGGEVNNSVFIGYSNKAHDGFLGNSVISEWCNIGADSNNSNLKNTYDNVKLWSYSKNNFVNTGLQFCGLIMGDHSKCSINTMFNTGTVVGVNCNVFGTGFPRNFIPSFSWGGNRGFIVYDFSKAVKVAEKVYERRNKFFNDVEINILKHVFDLEVRK